MVILSDPGEIAWYPNTPGRLIVITLFSV